MATSLFESLRDGVELNYVISCVWCKKQQLAQLVQLGCFHLSCKACLQIELELEDPRPGTPFNCPECDMSFMVPRGGLDGFPDEPLQHKMNQITAIFSNNNKPNCKLCEQVNRVSSISSVCITCKITLCEKDAKRHQGTPDHNVITNEELCIEPNLSLMLKSKTDVCQQHSLEKTYFCKKCQNKICTECGMLNHSDHKKDSVQNVATEYRTKLEGKMEEIKNTKRNAGENIQKSELRLSEIDEHLKKSGEKLLKVKGERELKRLNKEAKIRKSQANFEINEEKNKIKQCDSAKCYIKLFLKFSSDSDVIEKFQEFLSNLENCEITKEYKRFSLLSDKLQGMGSNESGPKTKGFFLKKTKQWCKWWLKTKWEHELVWWGVSVCEDEFLVVLGQKMQWFGLDGTFKREIECVDLEYACDVEVCESEIYVCDTKKRAVLMLDWDGRMKGSVCLPENEKRVKVPNDDLGLAIDRISRDIYVTSVRTNTIYKCKKISQQFFPWITNGLDEPRYICVTPDRHLIVSNWGSGTVFKYSPHGNLLWRYQLAHPRGVCTDPWGHIFIADFPNHGIVVVSNDGHHLMNIEIGEKIEGPNVISFGKNKLVITTLSSQIYIIKGKYC